MDEFDDHEAEDQQAAETLLLSLTVVSLKPAASKHEYERKAGTVTVRRGEAQLVTQYAHTDPRKQGAPACRRPDRPLCHQEQDLIEAKVSARHRYVRQALGQLLDYAAHCPCRSAD